MFYYLHIFMSFFYSDNVYCGSFEQLESIEPVSHAAGTVDSQDGSEFVM